VVLTTEETLEPAAVLMVGDTLSSPDIRHEVPVKVPDPIIYIAQAERTTIYADALDVALLEGLEGVEVAGYEGLADPTAPRWDATNWFETFSQLTVRACQLHGVRAARTPPRFPFAIAQALAEAGIAVTCDEDYFVQRRRVKTAIEVAGARRASRAVEAGWDAIREGLRERPGITSEELQVRAVAAIAGHDVVPYDIVIVPHGAQSAIGHAGGSGPVLAGEPVIADLIGRDRETGMYADVTRTFCVGQPPAELVEYFELCLESLEQSIAAVKANVIAEELNSIASQVFEDAGHPTLREQGPTVPMDRGFSHELGHGLGLEVHEPPLIGPGSKERLLEGEILCIEPALYRIGFGGCRLEDMVLVTSDGCERLTRYEYALEP
jgi:Xaa-Pro aminopeptidase